MLIGGHRGVGNAFRQIHNGLPFNLTINEAKDIFHKNQKFYEANNSDLTIEQCYIPFCRANVNVSMVKYWCKYTKKNREYCYYDGETFVHEIPFNLNITEIYMGEKCSLMLVDDFLPRDIINKITEIPDDDIFKENCVKEEWMAKEEIEKNIKIMLRDNALIDMKNKHDVSICWVTNDKYSIGEMILTHYYMPVYICHFGDGCYNIINGNDGKINKMKTHNILIKIILHGNILRFITGSLLVIKTVIFPGFFGNGIFVIIFALVIIIIYYN